MQMRMGRLTIKEVAIAAGVSTQTVSRVINKRPDVVTPEKLSALVEDLSRVWQKFSAAEVSAQPPRAWASTWTLAHSFIAFFLILGPHNLAMRVKAVEAGAGISTRAPRISQPVGPRRAHSACGKPRLFSRWARNHITTVDVTPLRAPNSSLRSTASSGNASTTTTHRCRRRGPHRRVLCARPGSFPR